MREADLHPTVREFKAFINRHPKLIAEVRKNGRSWQEYYEKWVLLGEDDSYWEHFKQEEGTKNKSDKKSSKASSDEKSKDKKTEFFSQLWKMTEKMDIDKVQEQVHQLNGAISSLQELLGQFQTKESKPNRPFDMFKD
ncbi:YlbD family protein [Virgibacillus sp. 179-BFC.A HS]|uniref:YlbD family protein n=1 Tax=Tigheibacillus jepli TaxID=3035914 RepID=A0ABU5CI05_9BACI|nr:YlbD family protein [Virgibacillus sp. 179-BFC.A HS]MDY0405988.1 YlbD family protein [Virgibacillus sp. 179-BFC.A HS]